MAPNIIFESGEQMDGQWTGSYTGTNTGFLVLEMDDIGDNYLGTIYAVPNDLAQPSIMGTVIAPKNKNEFSLKVPLTVIDRGTGLPIAKDVLDRAFPGTTWPEHADSDWTVEPGKMHVNWRTPIGTYGNGWVFGGRGANTTRLTAIPDIRSWSQFKEYVIKLNPYEFAFRGQEDNRWPLKASFYRTGRYALRRFAEQDVATLHRHLRGLTSHRFNHNDPQDFAAFLNLVQHHGYPTPLLDWTYSPFIAAYFAYRSLRRDSLKSDRRVRILIFAGKQWAVDWELVFNLVVPFRHATMLEPLAINNPRVVPQQSISMVTNVSDLESHISDRENEVSKTYLQAIDLHTLERPKVMRELDLMGINAGSLFPGLDGACRQLKERFFPL